MRACRLLYLVLVGLAACTADETGGDQQGAATEQAVRAGGDRQTGPAGAELAEPLAIRVSDPAGGPISGATVNWSVLSGGGSLAASQSTTDAQGLARAEWTLGPGAGPQEAAGSVSGLPPLRFIATALPGPPSRLEANVPQPLAGAAGTALRDSMTVRVTDAFGNPLGGVPVVWAVTAGAGSVSPDTTVTDSAGVAKAQWTLGPAPGKHAATAAASGLPQVIFAATVAPGIAARLERAGGDRQTGDPGAALPDSLVVRVSNGAGVPIAGASVGWQVAAGGGSIAPAIATTDTLGLARAVWTLGATPGAQTASAYAAGTTVQFTATAKP